MEQNTHPTGNMRTKLSLNKKNLHASFAGSKEIREWLFHSNLLKEGN